MDRIRLSSDSHLEEAMQRLSSISGLSADWDSYGASPPSPRAIAVARRLLLDVANTLGGVFGKHVKPFAVAPVANGGIHLEWRTRHGNDLEVEVGPDGTFGYLLVQQQNGDRTFQEAEDVPQAQILELLRRILLSTLEGRVIGTS